MYCKDTETLVKNHRKHFTSLLWVTQCEFYQYHSCEKTIGYYEALFVSSAFTEI